MEVMTRHDWAHGNKGGSVISIQNMIENDWLQNKTICI